MKNTFGALIGMLIVILTLGACKKNLFDQELYNNVITQSFPIEPIDSTHNWILSTRHSITIRVNANMENMERVMVLTANPANDTNAQIMAEKTNPTEGTSYTLLFASPEKQTTFYAAIKTTDNRYAIKPFTTSDNTIDFSNKIEATIAKTLDYQSFTFCFEENYPLPGDYDFNDCVMRMSLKPGSEKNQVKLSVTLAAVGAKNPLAGAVRLTNYSYDDIERVDIEDGQAFDDGYPLTLRYITNGATCQPGLKNEPVIRLFEDAMWSLAHNDADNIGVIERKNVNVTRDTTENNIHTKPITKTYIITFKETASNMLNNLLEDNLDPFIITVFNGGYWETHTYQYRNAQVLYEYPDQTNLHMLWALCIPSGTFRWPLEGILIGNYKNGILTGAYREYGHSFGQWATNKNQSKDWFFYPTESEVYKTN